MADEVGAGERSVGTFGAAGRVEAELRRRIESGELRPGDAIPTSANLSAEYGVTANTSSKAVQRLKAAGLLTGVAGGKTRVRVQPIPTKRRNDRYHDEKASVRKPEDERASSGTSEQHLGIAVGDLYEDSAHFEVIKSPSDIASALELPDGSDVLRRIYTRRAIKGVGISRHVSYIPYDLIKTNPDLLEAGKEPWPGGTQHQLSTVGIEIDHIVDHVTASMPDKSERNDYDVPPGIPILRIRKISYDIDGRPVEVSDIPAPADRTELIFRTQLTRWESAND